MPAPIQYVLFIFASLQMAAIIVAALLGAGTGDQISLVGLINVFFVLFAIVAAIRYDKHSNRAICGPISCGLLLLFYIIWCVIYVIVGLVLLLIRVAVIKVNDTGNSSANIFLGVSTNNYSTSGVVLAAIMLGFQFFGIIIGTIARKIMDPPEVKFDGFA